MAQIETWYNQDLQQAVKVRYIDGNVFSADNSGNVIGVNVFDGGEPAELSGTVSGSIIRADGATVAVTGTLADNKASIVLPQAAYSVPGVVSIVIKLTSGSVVTTLLAAVGNVYQTTTDTVVDPGTIIPDISALVAEIEAAVASIPADYSDLWTSLAPEFSTGVQYAPGDYATYDGGVWRFIVSHSGSWDAGDVIAVNLGTDQANLYTRMENAESALGNVVSVSRSISHGSSVTASNANCLPVSIRKGSIVSVKLTDTTNNNIAFTMYARYAGETSYTNISNPVTTGGSAATFTANEDIDAIGFYKNNLTSGTLTMTAEYYNANGVANEAVRKVGVSDVTTANISGIESNVIYSQNQVRVEGNGTYAYKTLCTCNNIASGDTFQFLIGSVTGATVMPPCSMSVNSGDTLIRRVYDYTLEITASDISSNADNVVFTLYPARGTKMTSGVAVFDDVVITKGSTDKYTFGEEFEQAFLNGNTVSNIWNYRDTITVYGSGTYAEKDFADKTLTLKAGDCFTFVCESVTGASENVPFTIFVYNGSTEIRRVYGYQLIVTKDDITSGANRILFKLYPARGTAMTGGQAVYNKLYAVQGYKIEYTITDYLKEATDNAITASNILYARDSVSVRGDSNYVSLLIYDENRTMCIGECFSLMYDSVSGTNEVYPSMIILLNGTTEIRRTYFRSLEITAADVTAGANRVTFWLYPAKGSAMPSPGLATYTNVRCFVGVNEQYRFTGVSQSAASDIIAEPTGHIPDYYFANNYLQNKVNVIRGLMSNCVGTGDAFVFITDEHIDYNQGHSPALISYINSKCNIPRVFSGGDIADHGNYSFPHDYMRRCNGRFYSACGNHEWMNPTSGSLLYAMLDMYNDDQIGNPNEHYFYVDNRAKKIRYIFLNTYINNPDPSVLAAVSDYTEEQLAWFTGEALNMPDSSWDAIIVTHYIGTYKQSSYPGSTDFLNAIDSFNSASTGGKVLFILQGHTHYDVIYHTTGGVPIITTTCDKNASWWSGGVNREEYLEQYRPSGTINEQAFDVVIVDRDNSVVKLVRIGCPAYDNVDITPDSSSFSYVPELEIRTVSF